MDFGDFFSGGVGRGLLGAGLGSLLASRFTPKAPAYTPVSQAQLDAATIPYMQQQANMQLANIKGSQGAKGGLSSADMFKQAAIGQQLAQGIGMQQAMNATQATNSANQIAQMQNAAARQRFLDILSGGTTGYNFLNPIEK